MPPQKPRARIQWTAVIAAISGWTLSIVTTAGLAAVGWYGHATHWKFGLGGDAHASHTAAGDHAGGQMSSTAAQQKGSAAADTAVGANAATAHPNIPDGSTIRFSSKEALARTGIELVPVRERPMVSEMIVGGAVQYDERHVAQLSARVPGSVWRVVKHLGDQVRKGDVLLIIDSPDVGRLKADFLNALVAREARQEQLSILEEVKGAVMGRQLREAKSALREARNHLTNAEQALVNLGFNVSIADYDPLDDDARASRIRTAGLPAELIDGRNAARITSNLLPLRAPFDGLVIGRDVVVGEVVQTAAPIFEVADVSTMWVVLNVSKEDAGSVAIGQPVRFRPDGSREEYVSRIAWISTEVNEETRTLEVRAEIANRPAVATGAATPILRANTFGSGWIEIDRRSSAFVVPRTSVQWDGSRWVVFVPAGEMAFAPRPVRPGMQDGEDVEICGDFAGDARPTHVVGAGSHVLKSQILFERMEAGKL